MRKLDLGCGHAKVKGAIGVDLAPLPDVDVVTNLDHLPYPFSDNLFDKIYLNDVIEHLPNTIKAMEELYRIVKPNGHVFIRVIHWSSDMNAADPTHVRAFTEQSFNYFGTYKDRLHYSSARFDVISCRRDYTPRVVDYVQKKRILRYFGTEKVLNLMSQYFNNIIDGLHFDLQARKPEISPEHLAITDAAALTDLVRCPYCLSVRHQRGWPDRRLRLHGDSWLVCEEPECQRKYPFVNGLPFMRLEDEETWRSVPLDKLPATLPVSYQRIPLEK